MTHCQRGHHALQRNENDVADDDFGLEGAGDVAWIWGLGFKVWGLGFVVHVSQGAHNCLN